MARMPVSELSVASLENSWVNGSVNRRLSASSTSGSRQANRKT